MERDNGSLNIFDANNGGSYTQRGADIYAGRKLGQSLTVKDLLSMKKEEWSKLGSPN